MKKSNAIIVAGAMIAISSLAGDLLKAYGYFIATQPIEINLPEVEEEMTGIRYSLHPNNLPQPARTSLSSGEVSHL